MPFSLALFPGWIRSTGGRSLLAHVAAVVVMLALSLYVGWKREGGPRDERTLEMAVIARQVAQGEGFTTLVQHPRTVAVLEARGQLDLSQPLPALSQPPLYPLALAGIMQVFAPTPGEGVWADPVQPARAEYPRYGGDRLLLGANLLFFWLALLTLYLLGRWWFSPWVAGLAGAAMLLSAGLWQQLVLVDGQMLTAWLFLLLLAAWSWREKQSQTETPPLPHLLSTVLLGLLAGLLFLQQYLAGWVALPLLAYLLWRGRGLGGKAQGIVFLVVFLGVIAPWLFRNVGWTGHPLGLAQDAWALRAADPTADPEGLQATLSAATPDFSIHKMLNKGLYGWRAALEKDLWEAGGYLLGACCFLGLLYPFRRLEVRVLHRWWAGTILTLILLPPFFGLGLASESLLPALTPILLLFGIGFAAVLIQSTAGERGLKPVAIWALLLTLHALPFLHLAGEPKRLPFAYPPYWPTLFPEVRNFVEGYPAGSSLVTDIPAGYAWYADAPVWAQPADYADFSRLARYTEVTVQLFSPRLLNATSFGAIAEGWQADRQTREWEAVYVGLARGRAPSFYPLKGIRPLHSEMVVTFRR